MFDVRPKKGTKLAAYTGNGPPSEEWLQHHLKKWWDGAADNGENTSVDPARNNFLRPSALPFCALEVGYRRITEGVEEERYRSFNDNFYVDIGTAVHELLQNFVGRMKVECGVDTEVETLGNWKCKKCGKVRMFTVYKACKCGGRPHYEEIEIKWRNHVGHIDKVIRIGKMLFILDYKTCSTYAIRSHEECKRTGRKSKLPYISNRSQITRYVGLFEHAFADQFRKGGKFHGCKIMGSILAYISRETVTARTFVYLPATPKDKQAAYELAERDDNHFVVMKAAVESKSKKLFLKLIDEKPCKDKNFYLNNMVDDFDPCPLVNICFRHAKLEAKVLKALRKAKKE